MTHATIKSSMIRSLLLLAVAAAACVPQDDSVGWLDNYQEALKKAKATGKPIFLEYRCEP